LIFMILAPTSTVIPVLTQTAAEHRMYLPLAIVVTVTALLAFSASLSFRPSGPATARRFAVAAVALAAVLVLLTQHRNALYHDPLALWQDSASKLPTNIRACKSVAICLRQQGRAGEAPQVFDAPLTVPSKRVEALLGRLDAWTTLGRIDLAARDGESAIAIDPSNYQAQNDLGVLAMQQGDLGRAIELLTKAIVRKPKEPLALINRGNALALKGNVEGARQDFRAALSVNPAAADAHFGLARLAHAQARLEEAAAGYERAIYFQANHADAIESIVDVYCDLSRFDKAHALLRRCLEEDPTDKRLILLARVIEA